MSAETCTSSTPISPWISPFGNISRANGDPLFQGHVTIDKAGQIAVGVGNISNRVCFDYFAAINIDLADVVAVHVYRIDVTVVIRSNTVGAIPTGWMSYSSFCIRIELNNTVITVGTDPE